MILLAKIVIFASVGIGGALISHFADKLQKNKDITAAKMSAFEDGMHAGMASAAKEIKKHTDFYLATTALSYYIARCDGNISEEEQLELDFDLDAFKKNLDLPDAVIQEIKSISSDASLSFEKVVSYLDNVSLAVLKTLENDVDEIIIANGTISPTEQLAKDTFSTYLREREQHEQS